jgi:hypothetical protein
MSMSRSPHRSSQGAMALLRKNVFGAKVTIRSRPLPAFDLSRYRCEGATGGVSGGRRTRLQLTGRGRNHPPRRGVIFSLAATA